MPHHPLRLLPAILLAALLLAACGGDSTPAPTDTAAETPQQSQADAQANPPQPDAPDADAPDANSPDAASQDATAPDDDAAQANTPDDGEAPTDQTDDAILTDPRLQLFDNDLTVPSQPHLPDGVDYPYETDPPYGGPHGATPAACGIYSEPIAATALVHSMEHGAVILYVNPDLATPDDATALDALATAFLDADRRVILTPSPTIASPIVLAAWGALLPLDAAEPDVIRAFVATFEDNAPERLPREFAC